MTTAINFTAERGTLVWLAGRNGSGKTTLLRTLSGMLPPLSGSVSLCGTDLTQLTAMRRARLLAFVTTRNRFPPAMSVGEMVMLGRYPHTGYWNIIDDSDQVAVHDALAVMELEACVDSEACRLSDGLRQRVVVARALAQDTPILLIDEPTQFLDPGSGKRLMAAISAIAHMRRRLIICASHDIGHIRNRCDAIWLLQSSADAGSDAGSDAMNSAGCRVAELSPSAQRTDIQIEHELFGVESGDNGVAD